MKSNVSLAQASSEETVLPERIQEALGRLVGAAKGGLLALSVGVGLGVLVELMEEEVDDVVGPKGRAQRGTKRGASRARGGYCDLAKLAVAIEHDLDHRRPCDAAHTPTTEAAIVAAV